MSGKTNLKTSVLVTVFSLAMVSSATARTIYVDDNGPADFNNIQAAIDDSNDGDIIVVSPGTYTGDGNRDIDYKGKAITVRSTDPNDREVVAGTVIDCEELKGGHRGFYFHNGEGPDSVLDGLTIANGYKVSWPDEHGGGIKCSSASPTIRNCIIRDNMASFGGGLYGCDGPVINCIITGNIAWDGGGLDKCGGPITNCIISKNSGQYGGGLCRCNGLVSKCIISNNSTAGSGGGLNGCSGLISNCVIVANTSRRKGGGLKNCGARIINCIISRNSAAYGGGGLDWFDSSATLVNCTISGNSGYAIQVVGSVTGGSDCTVANCILWGNSRGQITHNNWGSVSVSYSDVQGGWSGAGNINADPSFAFRDDHHLMEDSPCIDAGTNNPSGGLPTTGLDGNPRPLDGNVDGTPTADIGAYEYNDQAPSIAVSLGPTIDLFVEEDGPSNDEQALAIRNCGGGVLRWQIGETCSWLEAEPVNGESGGQINEAVLRVDASGLSYGRYTCVVTVNDTQAANDPHAILVDLYVNTTLRVPQEYPTIQGAIDAAMHGDTVLVAKGKCNENINFKGKNIILTSTNPDDPDVVAGTVINGGSHGSVVTFHGGENASCVLKGFTITGGRSGTCGGGIHGNGSTATISKCIITGNWAGDDGGGLYECSGEISNCVITDNRAGTRGAGLAYCDGPITNCIISNNCSFEGGGGLWRCDGPITNCTIANNQAYYYSGGIGYSDGPILNCIIWRNTIWGNTGGSSGDQITGFAEVRYSNYQGAWLDQWNIYNFNIDLDPCFVDPGYWDANGTPDYPWDDYWVEGDYHLLADSPCIDAGDPDYIAEPNDTDMDGRPRVIGGRIDMGAYEYRPSIPAEVRIVPRMINLASKGKWITCYIWLGEDYDVADIDSHSLLLEFLDKEIEPEQFWVNEEEQVAMARFSREEVQAILNAGEVEVTITGQLTDGTVFEAKDVIIVINKGSRKSAK